MEGCCARIKYLFTCVDRNHYSRMEKEKNDNTNFISDGVETTPLTVEEDSHPSGNILGKFLVVSGMLMTGGGATMTGLGVRGTDESGITGTVKDILIWGGAGMMAVGTGSLAGGLWLTGCEKKFQKERSAYHNKFASYV